MKKNVIVILMAALLITAGSAREFTPGMLSEVYHAEIITESGQAAPDEPDAGGLTTDESEPDRFEPEEPDSDKSEQEPPDLEASDSEEPEQGQPDVEEPDFEEPEQEQSDTEEPEQEQSDFAEADLLPEIGGDLIQGAQQTSTADLNPSKTETGETESEPESSEDAKPETEISEEAHESSIDEFAVGFAAISTGEAVVKTYSELRNALANDNGITTVYFGDNITMQAGIKINPKKAAVTIDGFNPLDPTQSQPYTLTDLDSASFYDTIYVDDAGTKSIHVRNLTIVGKNYYGPFSVYDMAGLAGFVITYERVNYNGPQLCYNRRGTVRLLSCSANIHGGNGILSPHQEFSEVKHLVFEGANSIDTSTNLYSVFWHPFGGSFTVADDASLTLTSPNTSTAFGVFFADSYLYNLDISVGSRAVFDMTISGFVAPELYITLNSLTVREGGTFSLKTTKTATAAVLRIGGPLLVEKDAKFIVSGYGGASYTALRQESGDITVEKDGIFQITAESPYTSLLTLIGRAFICDDPLSVLLINARRDIQAASAAGSIHVNAQQINYWNEPSPGGLDHPPLYKWTKANHSNVVINGTLSYFGNTDFSSLTSNHTAADPPGVSPSATTFSMTDARVLAFGRLSLIISGPTTQSTAISGVTEAGAVVRASFTQQGVDYTLPDVLADSEGTFHIPVGVGLQAGTVVKVKAGWQYLTADAEVTVTDDGQLVLFVPDVLEFYTTPLSASAKTVKRVNPEWKIVISDTREGDGTWDLYARLDGKLTPASSGLPVLEGALIFIDGAGSTEIMDPGADILIDKHVPMSGEDVFPIVWESNKGILLTVKPGAAFADTVYTASIAWTIVDGV